MDMTRRQATIKQPVAYSGIGIHTGKEVKLRFVPAAEGEGIFFKRTDLPSQPIIPARVEYVFDTQRSTNLALQDVRLYTVEHVLAAVRACEIDNLCIELSNIEPPAGDGSSLIFMQLLEEAKRFEQKAKIPIRKLQNPIYFSQGTTHIVAVPSDKFTISYTLDYPSVPALGTQFFSFEVTPANFLQEVAPCRTFALYEELSVLMDKGLIKGGSLENAVVIKHDAVISKDGLRFVNEMARHKVLDIIGDVSLIGIPFIAHIIAIRSGHATNVAFAKKLYENLCLENG